MLAKTADGKVPVRVLKSSEKLVKLPPEKKDALHVKAVQQLQVKVEVSTTEQLLVPVNWI